MTNQIKYNWASLGTGVIANECTTRRMAHQIGRAHV